MPIYVCPLCKSRADGPGYCYCRARGIAMVLDPAPPASPGTAQAGAAACDDHRPDGPDPQPGCRCAEIDRLCAPPSDAAFRGLLEAYADQLTARDGSHPEDEPTIAAARAAVVEAHRAEVEAKNDYQRGCRWRDDRIAGLGRDLSDHRMMLAAAVAATDTANRERDAARAERDRLREDLRREVYEQERRIIEEGERRAAAESSAEALRTALRGLVERWEACGEPAIRALEADGATVSPQGIARMHTFSQCARDLAAVPGCATATALRPEVLAFARVMHAKIEGHNHDRGEHGWRSADTHRLFEWLDRYVGALRGEVAAWQGGLVATNVTGKAANVANLAMMIADVCGGLAALPAPSPAAGRGGRG